MPGTGSRGAPRRAGSPVRGRWSGRTWRRNRSPGRRGRAPHAHRAGRRRSTRRSRGARRSGRDRRRPPTPASFEGAADTTVPVRSSVIIGGADFVRGRRTWMTLPGRRSFPIATIPIVLSALVQYRVTRNCFVDDDFLNLYGIRNYALYQFLIEPSAGHLLLARNAVFFLS